MSLIEFDTRTISDFELATSLEWLETNGLGGSASSTILGANTRRYHGLLTAATKPPVGRFLLLSKLEETLVVGDARYDLGVNQYAGSIHPRGDQFLENFRLDPFPVFTYQVAGLRVEKRVFMAHGENTVVVSYTVTGHVETGCVLEVRPLVAFRDYHSTTHANSAFNGSIAGGEGKLSLQPYNDVPRLHFAHNAAGVQPESNWYYGFQYARERERGLDFVEDLHCPLAFHFDLSKTAFPALIASLTEHEISDVPVLQLRETERRKFESGTQLERQLTAAADQFIVARADHKTVIAGYPWFTDWGRDTMISLPGLTLVTGRFDDARSMLVEFVHHLDGGMLPNRFPDLGETPEYNTVDATLWMFHAVSELLRYTGDRAYVQDHFYRPLADVIDWHVKGTRYGIRMDEDGLLLAGEPGVQLTWMDVKIGDWVVTPRQGKPVEIEALWYNALCVMSELAETSKDRERYRGMAQRASAAFEALFWNEGAGCLYDVIAPQGPDGSIRPNQILAVSLPYSMLDDAKSRRVLEVVEWELLTPYGLRTLSPRDPQYRGKYEGDSRSRDSSYHQGTVWPWLLGPFLTAYGKVHGDSPEVRDRVDRFLQPLREHLWQAGLGQISEVFDGDAPHRPGGCIAQAWSVAEVLRTYVEVATRSSSEGSLTG
jgi:predicted glycogen debranching enzyme